MKISRYVGNISLNQLVDFHIFWTSNTPFLQSLKLDMKWKWVAATDFFEDQDRKNIASKSQEISVRYSRYLGLKLKSLFSVIKTGCDNLKQYTDYKKTCEEK